ncbi:MAG: 50S ribosomal protein L15 [Patescibacteria group bacterium]
MQLHQLQRKTKNKNIKRVGRGGLRGKTSGRGTKGQKARAGHRIRPDVREKLKKLPKLRGYNFASIQVKPTVINVKSLEVAFASGDAVNPKMLIERGVIRARKGVTPKVKVLGDGELTKKLTVTGCTVSATAKEKIEKAGGTVA